MVGARRCGASWRYGAVAMRGRGEAKRAPWLYKARGGGRGDAESLRGPRGWWDRSIACCALWCWCWCWWWAALVLLSPRARCPCPSGEWRQTHPADSIALNGSSSAAEQGRNRDFALAPRLGSARLGSARGAPGGPLASAVPSCRCRVGAMHHRSLQAEEAPAHLSATSHGPRTTVPQSTHVPSAVHDHVKYKSSNSPLLLGRPGRGQNFLAVFASATPCPFAWSELQLFKILAASFGWSGGVLLSSFSRYTNASFFWN